MNLGIFDISLNVNLVGSKSKPAYSKGTIDRRKARGGGEEVRSKK